MTFVVRWPDGTTEACYSPSLVVREHLEVGTSYPVGEFVRRATDALAIGSDRIEAKFGHPCSLALGQSAAIRERARQFERDRDACVVVEAFA